MKVLMLGWEFPPHITGGLGTACEGLSKALAAEGVGIHFVMPKLYGDEIAPYMHLIDLEKSFSPSREIEVQNEILNSRLTKHEEVIQESGSTFRPNLLEMSGEQLKNRARQVNKDLPSVYTAPYWDPVAAGWVTGAEFFQWNREIRHSWIELSTDINESSGFTAAYGDHIFSEVEKYARRALTVSHGMDFDVIHAHDWMTYPAAIALGERYGRPVLLHVHSIESDRSGGGGNRTISYIERTGLERATGVIAVSQYTKNRVVSDYQVRDEKIFVVHNGLITRARAKRPKNEEQQYRVLFMGRITFQKGPDYFVEAAIRVLEFLPDTTFILAGSGDMLEPLRNRIRQAGVEKNFILPGFLKGSQVDEMLASADLYVMPSVSEPFGIAALEAIYYNVPTIVSRQSGVSEVVQHALKADFWDVEELADLMMGCLRYPELRSDLMLMAREEVKRLDWHRAARQVKRIYETVYG